MRVVCVTTVGHERAATQAQTVYCCLEGQGRAGTDGGKESSVASEVSATAKNKSDADARQGAREMGLESRGRGGKIEEIEIEQEEASDGE